MNNSKVTLLGFSFFIFCVALMGGVYFLNGELIVLQEEYDSMEQQIVDVTLTTRALQDRKRVFTEAFNTLENYQVHVASSDMGFYEEVQQVVQFNNINILTTRQMGVSRDGRSSLVLTLRGDYYSFTQVLAAWRNLFTTVRVSAMTMTALRTPEMRSEVQIDVTVEAIVSNK
jgi:hypothetical protein